MKAVSDPVFGPVRVRVNPCSDVLNFCPTAGRAIHWTTIIDMDVSPEICTVEVAHHWSTIIVCCKLVSIDFEGTLVWSFDRPFHPRHGPMTRFVLPLRVTFE